MTGPDAAQGEAREVAGYALVRRLGGGMDDVFEAVERATGARVALKVPREGADGVARARFERGVRLARRLDHPRVVRALAAGRDAAGRPWMAMELLAGEPLDVRARRGPLAPREAAAVARQVCEALAHAHARGVVHRDLKPHNVWLRGAPGADPDACLLDFGVARSPDEAAVTEGPDAVGTVAYMAPEQVRGGAAPDARSDLWSLGVTLHECLTGAHPFRDENLAATLYAVLARDPPDLRARRPDAPPDLAALVRSLLARDPAARPVDARAVIERLDAVRWDDDGGRDSVVGPAPDRWLGAVAEACDAAGSPSDAWEAVRRALAREVSTPPVATPFVGRELELDLLLDAVARAERERSPGAVLVVGGDAMGRTRLFDEAVARLAERAPDASVVAGRCVAGGAPFAALEATLGASLTPEPAPPDPQAAVDRARALLHAAVAGRAERGPVVVALDDAQHLDPPSRAALAWLVARCDDVPLALWLFAHDQAREALASVAPGTAVRALGPLDPASARRLLREALPEAPEGDVGTLAARADGHPFVLEELARMYRDEGGGADALPVSVEALHQAKLYRLGRGARGFLKRAAVFGREAWVEGVAALGGDAAALPALRREGLVALKARSRLVGCREFVAHGGSLLDVAYALWPEARRRELHALAARWLAARPGAAPAELARHWDLAGERVPAAEAYARAAEASARAGDAATARASAERVLALTGDVALRWRALVAQDEALQVDGAPAARAAGLDALEALAPRVGLAAMAEAAWRRCYHARVTRDRAGALHHGALAVDLGEARWASLARMELALVAANEGHFAEAAAHADRAAVLADECGDPVARARAAATRGYVRSESGDDRGACALMEEAAGAYRAIGDARREAIQRGNAGFLHLRLGRFEPAGEAIDAAITGSARVGNKVTLAVGRQNRATLLRALGRHADARRELDLAERLCAEVGFARLADAIASERGLLALASGAGRDELLACAGRARAGAASPVPQTAASCLAVALRCLAAAGAWDGALAARAGEALARADLPVESRLELRVATLARGGFDDVARAELRARFTACAGDDGAARSLAARLAVDGALLRGDGEGG